MSKVHRARWVKELDGKQLGHSDSGKKEVSLRHIVGSFPKGSLTEKNPWGLQIKAPVFLVRDCTSIL